MMKNKAAMFCIHFTFSPQFIWIFPALYILLFHLLLFYLMYGDLRGIKFNGRKQLFSFRYWPDSRSRRLK